MVARYAIVFAMFYNFLVHHVEVVMKLTEFDLSKF